MTVQIGIGRNENFLKLKNVIYNNVFLSSNLVFENPLDIFKTVGTYNAPNEEIT